MKSINISGNLLEDLKNVGGYYECPKNKKGERLGPLVGYAGRYEVPDGTKRAYVGDVYYNFAKMEAYPEVYGRYAANLVGFVLDRISSPVDVFLGAPMGGIILASDLARFLKKCRRVFAEKKVISAATDDKREESILVIDRHDINNGDHVILVEDICNNFSTTEKLIQLVEEKAGVVIAIACMLNRSNIDIYASTTGKEILVVSLMHIPTIQYRQDNPAVINDIAVGNVAWKPKNEWSRLKKAMAEAEINKAMD